MTLVAALLALLALVFAILHFRVSVRQVRRYRERFGEGRRYKLAGAIGESLAESQTEPGEEERPVPGPVPRPNR
jgi:hypothetical protein